MTIIKIGNYSKTHILYTAYGPFGGCEVDIGRLGQIIYTTLNSVGKTVASQKCSPFIFLISYVFQMRDVTRTGNMKIIF